MIFLMLINLFIAAETVNSGSTSTSTNSEALPHCVSDAKAVSEIKETISANSKTPAKYNGYRTALRSDSNAQLLARLAYAETLAARCPSSNSEVSQRIVQAIANRVRLRKGDVPSVVFQRDQFSSSMNIYDESGYKDFLCPKDKKLWSMVIQQANKALANPPSDLKQDTVNYFLYKHSPRWTKEPWKLEEDTANSNSEVRSCVRFFRAPGWK